MHIEKRSGHGRFDLQSDPSNVFPIRLLSKKLSICRCRASAGDLIIIAAFAQVHEDNVATHQPKLVFVNEKNQQTELRSNVPLQLQ